ncbi:hypothetical protein TL16_g05608 [Triparma laevis f. inornata]|uniref:Uncharacterized protein n=1 Tax=Triparma laevis f. inornata TaxID=1714386 RepID=A0A9W7AEH6_9STRA|nr:hypothetical protein TL16_g05608 [Triparma laevis f. inornata]
MILSTSSELPDLTPLKNVLTYSLTVNDIELTFKVILKIIKTPKTTIQLLIPIIKDLFNDREFRDNVSLELPGFLEVLYELLSLNNEKITEFVLGLLSGFKDAKSNKSMREGSRMEGGIVVGVDFYERLINVRPPEPYSEYTNILLSLLLTYSNLVTLKRTRSVKKYVVLLKSIKKGSEVMKCWRECCRRILRERKRDYEEEVKMRYEGKGVIERWYERWEGSESVKCLPLDGFLCEDRVLLNYLKVLREIGGEDGEVCMACCRLKGVGEGSGDWGRIEREEEELLGREQREWNETERIRETKRIHIMTAIRTVAGSILAGAENFKPEMQGGVLLMKSLGTIGKAVGCRILGQEDASLTEGDVRELMKTCLYQGGSARIESLKCLATLSQNSVGRRIILISNGVHVISTVLIAAVEGSVGEENFFLEREIIETHEDINLTEKYYENSTANLNTIERCCARILVHLAAAGDKERDEIAEEVHALSITDDVAKELIDVILDD